MELALTYVFITLALGGYLCGVLYVSLDGSNDTWWEPFLLAVVLPILWLFENAISIALTIGMPLAAIGLPVLVAELLRWIGLLS